VKDVVAAVDSQLRTIADARHRTIGGFSMGGFCALNLGLKYPDVFSVVLDFSGDTKPMYDGTGGNEALFGGGLDWQAKMAADDPQEYLAKLDPRKGPVIWMDVGTGDTQVLQEMRAFSQQLQARGFSVQFHTRPGGHDFNVWTAALKASLPWAVEQTGEK
jgi:enterochelin esterase-like enzyme